MYDDIFCQYGVACLRLETLLDSLEPSVALAPPGNDKPLSGGTSIRQAYTTCMNLQLRLNFLEQSILRLQKRKAKDTHSILPGDSDDIDTLIDHASYSKLKAISDWLVHVLVSLFGIDAPADCPSYGQSWQYEVTLEMCQSLFTIFCVKGTSVSRARVGALLLRTCGEKPWWGNFLAWVMEQFFGFNQSLVFSRER